VLNELVTPDCGSLIPRWPTVGLHCRAFDHAWPTLSHCRQCGGRGQYERRRGIRYDIWYSVCTPMSLVLK